MQTLLEMGAVTGGVALGIATGRLLLEAVLDATFGARKRQGASDSSSPSGVRSRTPMSSSIPITV
jgi:hypothetical protein